MTRCACGCGTPVRRTWVKGHNLRLPLTYEVDSNGCWRLTHFRLSPDGYADLRDRQTGRHVRAHRYFYERLSGPIPEGLVIDHLCRNPACVNPAHMEPVTIRENTLRGTNFIAKNAKKTHCPQGHPYSGDNLIVSPRGGRECKTCRRRQAKARYASEDLAA